MNPAVRALVDRFYDLMDLEPQFQALRALHPERAGRLARQALLVPVLAGRSGPLIERFGHPRLRARHLPPIGIAERDQWLAPYFGQAMRELSIDPQMAQHGDELLHHRRTGCATGPSIRPKRQPPASSTTSAPVRPGGPVACAKAITSARWASQRQNLRL